MRKSQPRLVLIVCLFVAGGGFSLGEELGGATQPATQPAPVEKDPAKQSLNNLRAIGSAIFLYANDHRGLLPENLDQLVEGKYLPKDRLTNPRTKATSGYDYIRPEAGKIQRIKAPHTVKIGYELMPDGLRAADSFVLFADGHVARGK